MDKIQDCDWILVGTALAVVELKLTTNANILTKIKIPQLADLATKLERIYHIQQSSSHLGVHLPAHTCQRKEPFLQNNLHALVYHALIAPTFEKLPPGILSFFHHLNNCYWCFEIYGQVFKGYFYGMDEYGPPDADA